MQQEQESGRIGRIEDSGNMVGNSVVPDQENLRASPNRRFRGEKELNEFGRKLLPYFHRFRMYAAMMQDSSSPSHPEQMRENGLRYRYSRKEHGLKRDEVAHQLGLDPVQLAAFESGLIPEADMPEGFIQDLTNIIESAPRSKAL